MNLAHRFNAHAEAYWTIELGKRVLVIAVDGKEFGRYTEQEAEKAIKDFSNIAWMFADGIK